jgi:hypothetical protein
LVVLGTWLGSRQFLGSEPASFKKFALVVLMTLRILLVARALM